MPVGIEGGLSDEIASPQPAATADPAPQSSDRLASLAWALVSMAVSAVLVRDFGHLRKLDLGIPFFYNGDALLTGTGVKSVLEEGWHLTNSRLGAPFGTELYDFPTTDTLHYLWIKVIGWLAPPGAGYGWTMNVFYVWTYPLTAASSFFAFRQLGLLRPAACAGAILYAFLPYHFLRGEGHLFLGCYYLVPWGVVAACWAESGRMTSRPWNATMTWGVVLGMLIASAGVYYAFFTVLFVALGSLARWVRERRAGALVPGLLVGVTIVAGTLLNLAPNLAYWARSGRNPAFTFVRPAGEAEVAGLRVTQLLLPVQGHRLAPFRAFAARYQAEAPLVNENRIACLGLVGSIGFLFLIGVLLVPPTGWRSPARRGVAAEPVPFLARMNALAVLYGTMGGLGSLVSFAIFSQFRGQNRISIFIAAFAIAALLLAVDRLLGGRAGRTGSALYLTVLGLLTLGGVLDQNPLSFIPRHDGTPARYRRDAEFVGRLEASLPPGSALFQLPHEAFPETPPLYDSAGHDPARLYLVSRTLRWSYGGMRSRKSDVWQRWVLSKPWEEALHRMALGGFAGIVVNRAAYPRRGRDVEATLAALLGGPHEVSRDGRWSFFRLSRAPAEPAGPGGTADADERRFYPMRPFESLPTVPPASPGVRFRLEALAAHARFFELRGWAFAPGEDAWTDRVEVVLRSPRRVYVIPTERCGRQDVAQFFGDPRLDGAGFSLMIASGEIEPGRYDVGVMVRSGERRGPWLEFTGRRFISQSGRLGVE